MEQDKEQAQHSGAMGGPLCQNQARRASTRFEIAIIAPGARDDWLAEVVLPSRNLFRRDSTDREIVPPGWPH
jgi:hypothetical protein